MFSPFFYSMVEIKGVFGRVDFRENEKKKERKLW